MTALTERIEALDLELFSFVPIQAISDDQLSLVALQAAVAASKKSFRYSS